MILNRHMPHPNRSFSHVPTQLLIIIIIVQWDSKCSIIGGLETNKELEWILAWVENQAASTVHELHGEGQVILLWWEDTKLDMRDL